jgi:amino acid permease family protein
MFLYRHWDKFKGAEYKYISNKTLGFLMGLWGFAFTAFACILGMVPQIDYAQNPSEWWFVLISNIIMPFALLGLGLVLPWIARREQKQQA